VVDHVVLQGHLSLLVANNGELQVGARDLIDVLDPSSMALDGVGRQANQLDASSSELWLELCESTEFGGADWSVVLGVGEENDPVVANELVEVDGTCRRLCFEVGGNGAESKAGDG